MPLKNSVCYLVIALSLAWSACTPAQEERPMGYSERSIGGKTWYFPSIPHWTPMDLMPIEAYQGLVNGSYMIDMAPIYGYISKDGGCSRGIVVSVVSKYAVEPYSEFDFVKRSPSEVHEMYVQSENGDSTRVLASIFSVKFQKKVTQVVLVHVRNSILGFELRSLEKCSTADDAELIEFVTNFLKLNTQ
jgi:hypothetical protein